MKTGTGDINGIRLGATLSGLICAGTAGAQQQQLDRQSEQTSDSAQTASCMAVDWVKDLLATAGPLPLIALAGFMSLLAGFGLTVRRFVARNR